MKEIVDVQIQQQGISSLRVKDGHVFVFTTETLEVLLAKSLESAEGRVTVFVRAGAES